MDKPLVIAEVARVLRPGALFAFSDFIARSGLTPEDANTLADRWKFPVLLRLPRYITLLDSHGLEVLLAEDRTRAVVAQQPSVWPCDQKQWEADFTARHGRTELHRQRDLLRLLRTLQESERMGYGMFVCQRRST